MTDLQDALATRAVRGVPRGADAVFWSANRNRREPDVDWPRRLAAAMAVAVVLALVAVAVLVARRDEPADQGPADEGGVEAGVGRVGGPVFSDETGATLLAQTTSRALVSLDLDTGTLRRHDAIAPMTTGLIGASTLDQVGDRFVYAAEDHLETVGLDLDGEPQVLSGEVNGRPADQGDIYEIFPSGDTDRFWVESGPIADAPERAFLAEERNLAGDVVSPAISLGRSGPGLVGATDARVLVGSDAGVEVRDRATGEVVRTLPGSLVAVRGERVVWQDACGGQASNCPLHLYNALSGAESTIGTDGPVAPSALGSLSPDGGRLAVVADDLQIVDLGSGVVEHADLGAWDGIAAGAPIWSPDGRWLFASHADPETGGLLGYRVGDAAVRLVEAPGFRPWSLSVAGALPFPAAEAPCEVPESDAPASPTTAVLTDGSVVVDDGSGGFPPDLTAGGPCLVQVRTVSGDEQAVPTTTIPPLADRLVPPSQISVLVANGAGVEGAAGAISAELTSMGYVPLPPTDTVLPVEETPLDTVYFATSPNTREQALRVTADLGLPESAVVPYPGVDTAPANIGLAQVLVVLGSAEGQLATAGREPPPDLFVTVEPKRDLSDGAEVTITGRGWDDRQGVMVTQCGLGRWDGSRCDDTTAVAFGTPGGEFEDSFTVREVLDTPEGPIDCRERACGILVGGVGSNTRPIVTRIYFPR